MSKKKIITGLIFILILLQLISLTTENWSVCKIPNMKANLHIGLNRVCRKNYVKSEGENFESSTCLYYPVKNIKDYPEETINYVKGMIVINLLLCLVAMIIMLFRKKNRKYIYIILLIIGILNILSCLLWYSRLRKLKIQNIDFDCRVCYSFYSCLASGIICLIGAYYYRKIDMKKI